MCRQGDEGDTFYIVVTGSVGIWIRGEPDTTSKRGEPDAEALGSCVHVMTAGDSFGERSLLLAEKRSASVVAVTRGLLFKLTSKHFKRFLSSISENVGN